MSDEQLPSVESDDAGIADRAIQHRWDRYAMSDLSVEPESDGSPESPTSDEPTNSPIATRAFDSTGKSSSDHEDSK